jgi:chromosome segregation and condensation protein ScpB
MPDNIDYRKLVEAALFMSSKAVSIEELSEHTGIASSGTLRGLLDDLINSYSNGDTSLEVLRIGDKYMFGLKEPYASRVASLAGGPDISKGALRILAYINKNEGVLQSTLVKTFGSTTYDYVKELKESEFIETEKYRTSKRVSTTQKFKEYFNV